MIVYSRTTEPSQICFNDESDLAIWTQGGISQAMEVGSLTAYNPHATAGKKRVLYNDGMRALLCYIIPQCTPDNFNAPNTPAMGMVVHNAGITYFLHPKQFSQSLAPQARATRRA